MKFYQIYNVAHNGWLKSYDYGSFDKVVWGRVEEGIRYAQAKSAIMVVGALIPFNDIDEGDCKIVEFTGRMK